MAPEFGRPCQRPGKPDTRAHRLRAIRLFPALYVNGLASMPPSPGPSGLPTPCPARWKISSKVRVLVTLPLLAVFACAALALYTTAGQALSAHRLRGLVDTATAAGELVHQLQHERVAAAALLAGAPDATRMNG